MGGLGAATLVTLAIVFLIVAVLAAYLITIAYTLYRVSFNLGTVLIGVRAIVAQVTPVPKYVGIILNDVMAIDQAAQQLLSWGKGPDALETASRVSTMRTSV